MLSTIVADCDVMNFVLVHMRLQGEVEIVLRQCDRRIVTLDSVYRREAQSSLRDVLDKLVDGGLCQRIEHARSRTLDKKQNKLFQQIYKLAEKHHRLTSDNDRGLLFEAQDRGALLFTEDGPLRRLAADRGQATFGAIDFVALLQELGHLAEHRRDPLLAPLAVRTGHGVDATTLRGLGAALKLACVESGQAAPDAGAPEGDAGEG